MENKNEKNQTIQKGILNRRGYDLWWQTFTGTGVKTGTEKTFFIACYVLNAQQGGDTPVFDEKNPSYVMVKAGVFGEEAKQLHRFYGINELESAAEELRVVVGDFFLSETVLKGSVNVTEEQLAGHPEYQSDAGNMSWLLQVNREVPYEAGYINATPLEALNVMSSFHRADGIRTQYSGTVHLDGERYLVRPETSFGYSGKTWGSEFMSPWIQLNASALWSRQTGEALDDTAVDVAGCMRLKGLPAGSNMLGLVHYEGKEYEFNFSKLMTYPQAKYRCREKENNIVWHVRMANTEGALEMKAVCPKSEMIKLRFCKPDGIWINNLWSGGTGRAELSLYRRVFGKLRLVDTMVAEKVGCMWAE